jgi:hypothetical protein
VFLTLKIMDFENVSLTKVVHVYVIEDVQCIIMWIYSQNVFICKM